MIPSWTMRRSSPDSPPRPRPASCPGVRSARSGPKRRIGGIRLRPATPRAGAWARPEGRRSPADMLRRCACPMSHIALRASPCLSAGQRRADHDLGENCGLARISYQGHGEGCGRTARTMGGAGCARAASGSRHEAGEHTRRRGRKQDRGTRGAAANGPARAPPRPLRGAVRTPGSPSRLVSLCLALSRNISGLSRLFRQKSC